MRGKRKAKFVIHIAGVAIFIVLLGGCGSRPIAKKPQPVTTEVIDKVFGGLANYELVKDASVVSACRLFVKKDSLLSPSGEYEYEQGPFVACSSVQAGQFREILYNPD